MGVMQNLGSNLIGSSVAPIVLVRARRPRTDWRTAFYVAAIPGLICAFLHLAGTCASRRRTRSKAAAERSTDDGAACRCADVPLPQHHGCASRMSCFMVAWMVLGWVFLPLVYANLPAHSRRAAASMLMALLGISAAVFAFIVPGLSDKLGRRPVMIVFTLHRRDLPARGALLHRLDSSCWERDLHRLVGERGVSAVHGAPFRRRPFRRSTSRRRSGLVMGMGEIDRRHGRADARRQARRSLRPAGADVHGDRVRRRGRYGVRALFLKETAPVKVGARALAPAPVGS